MSDLLPPYSPEERCREALMRSRVARWMAQHVRDQHAAALERRSAGTWVSHRTGRVNKRVTPPAPTGGEPAVQGGLLGQPPRFPVSKAGKFGASKPSGSMSE
jgi:hypothetical protein